MTAHLQTLIRRQQLGLRNEQPLCSRCDKPNPHAPKRRYCNPCHAEYMRRWRAGGIRVSREMRIAVPEHVEAYVYVIAEACGPLCKVGLAFDVADRLQTLQTGNGRELYVYAYWPVPTRSEAASIEHMALVQFSDRQGKGEWLNVPVAEVCDFIRKFIRPQLRDKEASL